MPIDIDLLDRLAEKFTTILESQLQRLTHEQEDVAQIFRSGISDLRSTIASTCYDQESTRTTSNALFGHYIGVAEVVIPMLVASKDTTDMQAELTELRHKCELLEEKLDQAQKEVERQVTRTGEFEILTTVDDGTMRSEFVRVLLQIFSDLDDSISNGFKLMESAEDISVQAFSAFSDEHTGLQSISDRLTKLSSSAADIRARADRLEPKDGQTIENTNVSLSQMDKLLDEHQDLLNLLKADLADWSGHHNQWRKEQAQATAMIDGSQLLFSRFSVGCYDLGNTTEEKVKAKREQGGRLVLRILEAGSTAKDTLDEKAQDISNIRERIEALRKQLLPLQSYLSRPVFDELSPMQQTQAIAMVLCYIKPNESLSASVICRIMHEYADDDSATGDEAVVDLLTRLSFFRIKGSKGFSMYVLTDSGRHWNRSWRQKHADICSHVRSARAQVDEQSEERKEQKRLAKQKRDEEKAQRERKRNDPAIIYNGLSDVKREMLALCLSLSRLPVHRDYVSWAKLIASASLTRVLVEGTARGKIAALLSLFKNRPRLFGYTQGESKRSFVLTELGRSVAAQFPPVPPDALQRTLEFVETPTHLWLTRQKGILNATKAAAQEKLTLEKEYFE